MGRDSSVDESLSVLSTTIAMVETTASWPLRAEVRASTEAMLTRFTLTQGGNVAVDSVPWWRSLEA